MPLCQQYTCYDLYFYHYYGILTACPSTWRAHGGGYTRTLLVDMAWLGLHGMI